MHLLFKNKKYISNAAFCLHNTISLFYVCETKTNMFNVKWTFFQIIHFQQNNKTIHSFHHSMVFAVNTYSLGPNAEERKCRYRIALPLKKSRGPLYILRHIQCNKLFFRWTIYFSFQYFFYLSFPFIFW